MIKLPARDLDWKNPAAAQKICLTTPHVKIEENTAQPTVRKFTIFFAKKFLTTIFLESRKISG
jgi:hypothetical protein